MSMNRREWLTRVFGATVAAAAAPLVDLTDATPAFWNQEPLKKLMPWKVTFPDGTTWLFDAKVVGEKLLDDGSVSFSVQPIGEMKLEEGPAQLGTTMSNEERGDMELEDVSMNNDFRTVDVTSINDDARETTIGILRRGTLTMKGRFV